jgi:hypothetical protein
MMKKIIFFSVAAVGAGAAFLLARHTAPQKTTAENSGGNEFKIDSLGNAYGVEKITPIEQNSFLNNVVSDVKNVFQPRGIRNNNPLNIKWASVNNWNGQTGKDSGGFSIFDKPENGIRAAAKILDSYARRGIVTIADIVKTWAPASENNVDAYTKHVEQAMQKSRSHRVTRSDYLPLLRVMIKHENGKNPYTDSQILAGISAA